MEKKSPLKSMTFLPVKKVCSFSGHPSVLEVALAHHISLNHSCGGMGSCTTCLVRIKSGLEKLHPPEDVEAEHVQMRGFQAFERLACQISAIEGLVVEIPPPRKDVRLK